MTRTWTILLLGCCLANCTPKPPSIAGACYQGRLVKKGTCGQRVVELLGKDDTRLELAKQWRDSLSGREYQNVFTVANSCDFPANIQQGETFSFRLTASTGASCVQCYAYTPVPTEKNNILIGCTKQ
ncbi:MAG: hypothetical protein JO301_07750 [Chitinophagaceae bacterium]|nr:hypothetical protein [Chitinophagaceae bacterium]